MQQAVRIINTYHPDIVFGYVHRGLSDAGKIKHMAVDESPEELVHDYGKDRAVLLVMHSENGGIYYIEPGFFFFNLFAPSYRWLLFAEGVLIHVPLFIVFFKYRDKINVMFAYLIFYVLSIYIYAIYLCLDFYFIKNFKLCFVLKIRNLILIIIILFFEPINKISI